MRKVIEFNELGVNSISIKRGRCVVNKVIEFSELGVNAITIERVMVCVE